MDIPKLKICLEKLSLKKKEFMKRKKSKAVTIETNNKFRVVDQEWLDSNGYSPLEDVINRIEGKK